MLPSLGGYKGPLQPLSENEKKIKQELTGTINYLAGELGQRNIQNPKNLDAAAIFIKKHFALAGLKITEQVYSASGRVVKNIIGEKTGRLKDKIIIFGAHYDSVIGSPGADDNASGVAAIISIAKQLQDITLDRTIRFIAFCTEEPPYFYGKDMGSWHYAKMIKSRKENVIAMFSIESIGYYSTLENSQHYPMFLGAIYPDKADFIGFVSNLASSKLLSESLSTFRKNINFPSEGLAAPTLIPGVGWSDQWAFWKMGYHAVMITDTAPYRNPNYHTSYDLPETLDYERMARVVFGLKKMLNTLSDESGN